jgi:hypothetical protein
MLPALDCRAAWLCRFQGICVLQRLVFCSLAFVSMGLSGVDPQLIFRSRTTPTFVFGSRRFGKYYEKIWTYPLSLSALVGYGCIVLTLIVSTSRACYSFGSSCCVCRNPVRMQRRRIASRKAAPSADARPTSSPSGGEDARPTSSTRRNTSMQRVLMQRGRID